MTGCRFHDRDLGPCVKVAHGPEYPHICTRKEIVHSSFGTLGKWDDPLNQPLYSTEMFDGWIVLNTCEPWCSTKKAPLGALLVGRFACDCKGPLRRLGREARRDLRAWIFADNEYQRLGAILFTDAARPGSSTAGGDGASSSGTGWRHGAWTSWTTWTRRRTTGSTRTTAR